jgi:hypothetical protein
MLVVMLREYGPSGYLRYLKTQSFAGLDELAGFFTAAGNEAWDSAEVVRGTPETENRVYSATALRALAAAADFQRDED